MRSKKKKEFFHIFLWITIPLLIYLCYIQIDRLEVSDMHFVEILCIDKTDNGYSVTALYDNAGSKKNDGLHAMEGDGDSVYTAYIDMTRKNSKDISLDHTSYFMIGQNAAADNLADSLDFIAREPDMKTNAKVFIVRAKNTTKLIKDAMEDDFAPSETLDSISQKQGNNLKKPMNTLLHVLNDMDHSYNNLLIPYLVYEDKTMYLEGYATFENQKLYGFLNYESSQAVDLFRNNLRTCPLELTKHFNVELKNLEVNPQISLNGTTPSVQYRIKTDSVIKESTDSIDVFQPSTLSRIHTMEQYKLMEQLKSLVALMKEEHLDLLNIGTTLEKQMSKEQLDKNWETYLENLDISLSVKSATAKTYNIETFQRNDGKVEGK